MFRNIVIFPVVAACLCTLGLGFGSDPNAPNASGCKALYASLSKAEHGRRNNTPESIVISDVRALHGPESATDIVRLLYSQPLADLPSEADKVRGKIDRECF